MKNLRRSVILSALVLAVFPLALAANGSKEKGTGGALTGEEPWDYTLPMVTGDVTLSYYTPLAETPRQYITTLAENYAVQEHMERTGITLEFMHPPIGDNGEFLNVVLASGDYPDVFKDGFASYPGGPDGAMDDGVIVNMNEYIEKYTPSYMELVKKYGQEKNILSDQGTIIKYGTIFMPPFLAGKTGRGLILRSDLLEKYGLESPDNLDDFTKVLRTFKANGIEIPLVISKYSDWMWNDTNIIASAFGTTHRDFYVKDGKTYFGPMTDEYKEYLTYLKMLYDEGLLDPDFATHNRGDSIKLFQSGTAGACNAGIWELRTILDIGDDGDPSFAIEGVDFFTPAGMTGENPFQNTIQHLGNQPVFVSSACEDPILVAKFYEYLHQPENMMITSWGPGSGEYPTYEMVDGKPVFTDFMQKKANPLKADFPTMRALYTDGHMTVHYDNEMEMQQYDDARVLAVFDTWSSTGDSASKYPQFITPTVEESKEIVKIYTDVKTYVEEMFHKFVMGSESLDNYDAYVAEIKDMGIERALELKQAGLERYLVR